MSLSTKLLPGIETFFRITDVDTTSQNTESQGHIHTLSENEIKVTENVLPVFSTFNFVEPANLKNKVISPITKDIELENQIHDDSSQISKEEVEQSGTYIAKTIQFIEFKTSGSKPKQIKKTINLIQPSTNGQSLVNDTQPKRCIIGARWTQEDDQALLDGVKKYGRQWTKIIKECLTDKFTLLGDKLTPHQVQQRYDCTLDRSLKKGKWSMEEDAKLRELVAEHTFNYDGTSRTSWSAISKKMGNRSVNQCQGRYSKVLCKNQNNSKSN